MFLNVNYLNESSKKNLVNFKILASSDSDFHVKVKESLLISRDEPILNKNEASLPLYLFD